MGSFDYSWVPLVPETIGHHDQLFLDVISIVNALVFGLLSTHNWVSVYTLYITSTPFCLYYPKVCIPPLTATHNDLYHFESWVLIKKSPQKLMT